MVQLGKVLAAVEAAVAVSTPFVWVAQLAECWVLDPHDADLDGRDELRSWRDERRKVDSLLLGALTGGKVMGVRRAVLYDVSSDVGGRVSREGADPASVHHRVSNSLAAWKQDLARYVAFFDDGTANQPLDQTTTPLSIQEVILGRVRTGDDVDRRVRTGELDGCITTATAQPPPLWGEMARMISMHGDLGIPAEDADPLSLMPTLELLEYRRR
jgi:hypothetical protein